MSLMLTKNWRIWKKYFPFLLLLPLSILLSCSRIMVQQEAPNTPTSNFNQLWNSTNEHYSFFEYKNINWDSIRKIYAPRVYDTMTDDSLYRVLNAMLQELRDGHVNLRTPFDYGRNWSWKTDFPDNFNENIINRNYLKNDYFITRALQNQWLRDSVGYIRYAAFSSPIADADLDFVFERFKNSKGIIFDIRDNGGGSLANVNKIMARLVEKQVEGGYSLVKDGKGHNDFRKKTVYTLKPYKKKKAFLKPFVVLTNRGCYSASTFFASFMSLLPQVTLIGDKTGGGGGLPISTDLPNGWQARFSGTITCLPNGFNIENGMPPDIQVALSPEDEAKGIDTIIERAIEEIKNKSK